MANQCTRNHNSNQIQLKKSKVGIAEKNVNKILEQS